MSPEDTQQLLRLLTTLAAEGHVAPRIPLPIWLALGRLTPQAAVEVIITRDGADFLLTYRRDDYWDGWHIPGGYVGCNESIADACNRVAQRELGIDVRLSRVITAYSWPDHPCASSISLVCACATDQVPCQGRFFSELPDPMVPHHADFIRAFRNAGMLSAVSR